MSGPLRPAGLGAKKEREWWHGLLVAALLLVYVTLAVSAAAQKSTTYDEIQHLTSGYVLWTEPGYRVAPENGVLAQKWAALPLLFGPEKPPPENAEPYAALGLSGEYYRFFYAMGNDPAKMLFESRTMIALIGAALGALIFFWSRALFGTGGAFLSLLMFVFCPTMLANGAVVTADMAATLGFLAATLCFWKLTHAVTWQNLACSLVAVVLLVLTKMSAILLAPIFAVMLIVRVLSRRPVEIHLSFLDKIATSPAARDATWFVLLALHVFAAQASLWLFYNFTYYDSASMSGYYVNWITHPETISLGNRLKIDALQFAGHAGLLPPAYLNGLAFTLGMTEGRDSYLWGHVSQNGSIWFFPFSLLIKTPVASLLLFFFSFVALLRWGKFSQPEIGLLKRVACPSLYELSPLLVLGGVYGFTSLTSHLNIGHRHIMPIYPVLFILAGANVYWWRGSRIFQAALLCLFAGLIGETLVAWPNYLSFFNQWVGGSSQGYRYLVDSSLDWGQDLPGLRRWLDQNVPDGEHTPIYLSYFGTGDPRFYGIRAQLLPCMPSLGASQDFSLHGGVYCVSATLLASVYVEFRPPWTQEDQRQYDDLGAEVNRWDATAADPAARVNLVAEKSQAYWDDSIQVFADLRLARLFAFLHHRNPDANVGGSILIYRLSEADVQQALTEKILN